MTSKASTPKEYLDSLPEDRKKAVSELRKEIKKNLPRGFKEVMDGMLGYVIPHSLYPNGYHCDPKQPLPFIAVASQKNGISVYHMAMYMDPEINKWFTTKYAQQSKTKLDMGKCCIRFKKMDQIPYKLIGELASKITPDEYITMYEKVLQRPVK